MTQEEKKELLLKDLCARIPYGLKASVSGYVEENITFDILSVTANFRVFVKNPSVSIRQFVDIEVVMPYLRSMSSMTEEEKLEYTSIDNRAYCCPQDFAHIPATDRIDWLNAHHFDYRGLIEKGLALEAPEGMYNN
jgi:hypothetical protein